jgi:hypothetical protein
MLGRSVTENKRGLLSVNKGFLSLRRAYRVDFGAP